MVGQDNTTRQKIRDSLKETDATAWSFVFLAPILSGMSQLLGCVEIAQDTQGPQGQYHQLSWRSRHAGGRNCSNQTIALPRPLP